MHIPALVQTLVRFNCIFRRHRNCMTSNFQCSRSVTLVRIRIRGSLPQDYGAGSCSSLQRLSRCQQKLFFQGFFANSLPQVPAHLHQSSKIKSYSESKSRLFLIFCVLMEGSGTLINFFQIIVSIRTKETMSKRVFCQCQGVT